VPDELLDTPAQQDPQQPEATPPGDAAEGSGGAAAPTPQEQFFLDVDERHRYRTKEDAVRSIQESGRRIGELTPWAEHAQRYGLTDPNALPQIFDNYLQMRDRLVQLEAQLKANDRGQAPAPQTLSPQDKANVEYLENHGFTRKEAIDKVLQEKLTPLEQRLQFLTEQVGRSEAQQDNAVVESGRNHLSSLMTAENLPVNNPELNEVIEDSIIAWMEQRSLDGNGNIVPDSPLDKFYRGGSEMREVVEQGFKRWASTVNVLRQNADAQYQRSKEKNVSRTPRPLPRQGAPVPTKKEDEPATRPRTPGAGGIFTDPALHDRAWERMQEASRE